MLLQLPYNIKIFEKRCIFYSISYDCVTSTTFYTTQAINQEDPEIPHPKSLSDLFPVMTQCNRREQELPVGTQTSKDWNLKSHSTWKP